MLAQSGIYIVDWLAAHIIAICLLCVGAKFVIGLGLAFFDGFKDVCDYPKHRRKNEDE